MKTESLLPTLPALRSLGNLADAKPVIVVDSREQLPLKFTRLQSVRAGLDTADYSFLGGETVFGVERKSVQDLVGCCTGDNRARFERELVRLRGHLFKRLLIVGTPGEVTAQHYRGRVTPKVVMNTLSAFDVRYAPVVWCLTPEAAALQIESWAWWYSREVVKAANALLAGMPDAAEPQLESKPQNNSDEIQTHEA
jgi:DNA excision repair protein ERCC-4